MKICPKCGYIEKENLKEQEKVIEQSKNRVKSLNHNQDIRFARINVGLGKATKEERELARKKLVNINEI